MATNATPPPPCLSPGLAAIADLALSMAERLEQTDEHVEGQAVAHEQEYGERTVHARLHNVGKRAHSDE